MSLGPVSETASEQTYYRWRSQYAGLKADNAKGLTELERQNATQKLLLAGAELEKPALKELGEDNFQARALTPPVPIAEQLLEKDVSLVGLGCLLAGLTKAVLGTALEVEMSEHLGCEKHQASEMPVAEVTEWQCRQLDRVSLVCSSTHSS